MVAYPIKHGILMEGKLITLWLAAIWIVSGLISVLPQVHIHGRNMVQNFGVIKFEFEFIKSKSEWQPKAELYRVRIYDKKTNL